MSLRTFSGVSVSRVARRPESIPCKHPERHHVHALVQPHPHSGATYRLVARLDNSFGVEVTIPGMSPTMVTGFGSQAEAERWIAKHKEEVAMGNSLRRRSTVFRKI